LVVAVKRREAAIDFASARDTDLKGVLDPEVLALAAHDNRILITHDRQTMVEHFRRRLEIGNSSPGLLLVAQSAALGPVVEAIILAWAVSDEAEWRDQIHHLPSLARHVFSR
jgi:hypothetical protein